MVEFSRTKKVSDANFPLFKIPKQWSYTLPVFPILLVSGRTAFAVRFVDSSKDSGAAAKYQAVPLLFGLKWQWQNFLFESFGYHYCTLKNGSIYLNQSHILPKFSWQQF